MDREATPEIVLVWAEARNGVIGRSGGMPWHLPEDLSHFKRATLGSPVVMGRRTWESLPERFRPLPGRENIVVSRDTAFEAAGARVVRSIEEALASEAPRISVIGGGEIFRAVMPRATELIVTRIDLDVPDADTWVPQIGPEWRLTDPGEPLVSQVGLGYRFERYLRQIP